jgi:hypothetical protein
VIARAFVITVCVVAVLVALVAIGLLEEESKYGVHADDGFSTFLVFVAAACVGTVFWGAAALMEIP